MDAIMSFLPLGDQNSMTSASQTFYQWYCRPIIIQKCINLILTSSKMNVAMATIDSNTAINSDHTPVMVSVLLHNRLEQVTTQMYTLATCTFALHKLEQDHVVSHFRTKIYKQLANNVPSASGVDRVRNTILHATGGLLKPTGHKQDSEAVGTAQHYTHKTIKVTNFMKRCIGRGEEVQVTQNMLQLTKAPSWARCELPKWWSPGMATKYL
jgi:hypothetical protein